MANINFVLIFTYGATLILTRFSPKLNPLELLVTAITQNLKMIVNDHSRPDGILLHFQLSRCQLYSHQHHLSNHRTQYNI